jgi:hypothetical protein
MFAWITFSDQFGFWSPFVFWTVIVSVILTLGFTAAVFFGGIADVVYLLRSLDAEHNDKTNGKADQ